MPITYTVGTASTDNSANQGACTTSSMSLTSGDMVLLLMVADDNTTATSGTHTPSNSSSALTWNTITPTNVGSNTKIYGWWAQVSDNTARTFTITSSVTSITRRLYAIVHTGAHASDPVPSANIFTGAGGQTSVSRSITPTDANGSALWMAVGDWNATNAITAGTNCTLADSFHDAGQMSAGLLRPTTQPRTDGSAFTLAASASGGALIYMAVEVRAAATSSPAPKRALLLGVG